MTKSILLQLLVAALLFGQKAETPLKAIPYTPSLDIPSMDKSVNPCVDFYHYACGGWIKNNPVPPDQAAWSVYAKLQEANERFLWGLLGEAAKAGPNRDAVQREIGDFFHACMDEAAVNQAGAAPLQPGLEKIAALKSVSDLPAYLGREHLTISDGGMMFGFGSGQDLENSNNVIAFAAAGGLGLPDRDYYTETDAKSDETRRKYTEHVARMLELMGEAPQRAAVHARTVMEIESALAKASLTRVERRDPYNLLHKMTPVQLQALTPSFHWSKYLEATAAPPTPVLDVTEPAFFKALDSELKSRSVDDWKTYLRWHLVHREAPYLSSPFVEADFEFYAKYLHGVKEMESRWKRCGQWVDRDLGEALGQVFVQKAFPPEVKQRTLAMTKEIEAAMQSEIQQLPWMSDPTKRRAIEKLHAVVNKIGYPDKWRDYSSIRIDRLDFLGNVNRANVFESERQLAKIGKPVDRGEWGMTPPTVNAYYSQQMNDITFPAGVLQPPLYDPKMDDAPNYGNTGATIGHELTHGFDDQGRKFDAQGNLNDWWTPEDARQFQERADCVSDQYSEYTIVDDIKINGRLTMGEDVADLGGTLLAYIAWRHADAGQNLKPIEGFTPDQRFFIGMAQWACTDERPENKRVRAITDEHSPEEYRINGVVSNMPEFANAFACKLGQPMVRPKPCRVW
jgi:putative endopeptidase